MQDYSTNSAALALHFAKLNCLCFKPMGIKSGKTFVKRASTVHLGWLLP